MGTIKLEFDIPEFEKELKIEIVLSKDGEVVYNTTSSPSTGIKTEMKEEKKLSIKKEEKLVDEPSNLNSTTSENSVEPPTTSTTIKRKKKFGGNMMDLEL